MMAIPGIERMIIVVVGICFLNVSLLQLWKHQIVSPSSRGDLRRSEDAKIRSVETLETGKEDSEQQLPAMNRTKHIIEGRSYFWDDQERLVSDFSLEELEKLFIDGKEYFEAENYVSADPTHFFKNYDKVWPTMREHEVYFKYHRHKLFIPTLAEAIPPAMFIRLFVMTSTPVLVPQHVLKQMNYGFDPVSFEDLQQIYKYDPNHKQKFYSTMKFDNPEGTLSHLGYGLHELFKKQVRETHPSEEQMNAWKVNKFKAKYPHTLKANIQHLEKLGIPKTYIPLLNQSRFKFATVFFSNVNDDTETHQDGQDNFSFMLNGEKEWIVYPPPEARYFYEECHRGEKGRLECHGDNLLHPDDLNSSAELKSKLQKVSFTLKSGTMLYLPCGWLHHVHQTMITSMVSTFVRGSNALYRAVKYNHDEESIFNENFW